MLVDVIYQENVIANIIAQINGNSTEVIRREQGVYEIGHFSFDNMMVVPLSFEHQYPKLWNDLYCFGICDDYQQIFDQCPQLRTDKRRFCISITPIIKEKEPPTGGWRWHKWGPYIGEQKPTTEYLYDEPVIEKVYCYHIYEI